MDDKILERNGWRKHRGIWVHYVVVGTSMYRNGVRIDPPMFTGRVYNVKKWSYALSPEEVRAEYKRFREKETMRQIIGYSIILLSALPFVAVRLLNIDASETR